jgi:hypothetical protein
MAVVGRSSPPEASTPLRVDTIPFVRDLWASILRRVAQSYGIGQTCVAKPTIRISITRIESPVPGRTRAAIGSRVKYTLSLAR